MKMDRKGGTNKQRKEKKSSDLSSGRVPEVASGGGVGSKLTE